MESVVINEVGILYESTMKNNFSDGNGMTRQRDSFEQIALFVGPWIGTINEKLALIRLLCT